MAAPLVLGDGLPAVEPLVLVAVVVFGGGFVKGLAGFGYAVASTAVLATVLPPATAVVVMILPTLVANVVLLRELGREDLRTCFERFWPYLGAAVVGTVAGMVFLRRVETASSRSASASSRSGTSW